MNWLDWLLAVVLAGSIIGGMMKGFAREIVGFISVIAALFGGIWLYGTAGSFLIPYVSSKGIANFCGFVIVFFGVLLLGAVIGYILRRLVKAAGLSAVDRLMGMGFGAVRGVLLAIAFVLAIMAFAPGPKPPQSVVDSRFAPYVIDAARVCSAVAPFELKDGFRRSYDEIRGVWDQTLKKGIRGLPRANKADDERKI